MLNFLLENASFVSYLGIAVVLILTGAGLPVPEEVIIIAAGIASSPSSGALDPWMAWASCLAGALVGDYLMYWIGFHFGRSVLREHRWFPRFLTPERERRVEQLILLHGPKVFFLARFLVGLRGPVYLTAGILRYPFRKFVLIDAFCATLVVSTFFALSYRFADHVLGWWKKIHDAELALTVAIVAAIVGIVLFFYIRHRRRVARIRVKQHLRSLKLRVHTTEPAANESKKAAG